MVRLISPYGRPQTTGITFVAILMAAGAALWGLWWLLAATLLAATGLLAFFRDPDRKIPTMRGQVVAPADGRVRSVHRIDHFEPFDGPARCVRIFLSVLDVHINRAPLHGRVRSITHRPGRYLNALRADAAEQNEALTLVLEHPLRGHPVAAVRQIAGTIARRIVCVAELGQILQRGKRYGMIKFGSTTELYLPDPEQVQLMVREGDYVYGGSSVVALLQTSRKAEAVSASRTGADPAPTQEKVEGRRV